MNNTAILPQIVPITNKKVKDIVGQRFGRLVVIGYAGSVNQKTQWLCQCDCGNSIAVVNGNLKSGNSQSCGCLQAEQTSRRSKTHGMSKDAPEYGVWNGVIRRCCNANDPAYPNYGGRGIKICDRWRHSFQDFYVDMGLRPTPHHTLERKDVNGNYEPSNCCWATRLEQNNNRRNTVRISFQGQEKTLSEWAVHLGVKYDFLHTRIYDNGWSVERAFTTPRRKINSIGSKK